MRFLADENFNGKIVDAVRRLRPSIRLVTAQEAGLTGMDDAGLLAWAAEQRHVILSHDVKTLGGFAVERVASQRHMYGVLLVVSTAPMRRVIEEIVYIEDCGREDDWVGQVQYLPL